MSLSGAQELMSLDSTVYVVSDYDSEVHVIIHVALILVRDTSYLLDSCSGYWLEYT